MSQSHQCQSCSMTIESGTLCRHGSNDKGELLAFDEWFTRFVQWNMKANPDLQRAVAEAATLQFMSSTPTWGAHALVAGAQ